MWAESDSLGAVFVCICGWRSRHMPHADPESEAIETALHGEWSDHLRYWRAGRYADESA